MNTLTTFGVEIDPTKAVQGAAVATKAAASMGAGMKKSGEEFERGAQKAGAAGKKAGSDIEEGVKKGEQAVQRLGRGVNWAAIQRQFQGGGNGIRASFVDIAQATGLLDGPLGAAVMRFDAFKRVLTSFVSGVGAARQEAAAGASSFTGLAESLAGVVLRMSAATLGAIALTAALGGILAVAAGLGIGLVAAFQGVTEAGKFETMENQLAVLLGSFDKAKERLAEITELALKTPFQMKDLTEGNRLLETFTQGALSTREAMLTIGDAAAGAGRNFNEVAMWVGRMYASLKGGQPIGEATMRLMEMGLILPGVKGKLDAMAESGNKGGKNFAEIWAVAEQSLKRFDGAMLVQSQSWEGLMSSLSDSWTVFTASLGEPIMTSLKPALQEAIDMLGGQNDLGANIGEAIAGRIRGLTAMFATGNFWEGMARNMWATIATGLIDFTANLTAAFQTGGEFLLRGIQTAIEYVGVLTQGSFWSAMSTELVNAAKEFGNYMLDAAQNMLNALLPELPSWMGGTKPVDFSQWKATTKEAVADFTAPDWFAGNNGDFSVSGSFTDNAANMKQELAGTREYWTEWAADWNALELQPMADKIAKDWDKNALKLPSPATTGQEAQDAELEKIKKAKAVREPKAKDLRSDFQKLTDEWRNMAMQIDQFNVGIARSMSGNISNALTEWIMGTKSAKDAFNDMAIGIVNDIVQMTIKMLVQYALAQALGWVTGGVAPVAVAHTGGTVGGGGLGTRTVDTGSFGGAPRFAHGGAVRGVGSGEVPIIAEPGEEVLTRAQSSDIKGKLAEAKGQKPQDRRGGGGGVTVINVSDPREIEGYMARNPDAFLNILAQNAPKVRRLLGQKG